MSYQEYAQLGKGTRREDDRSVRPQRRESDVVNRPYHRATASFSVPRRPSPTHSSSSSTSSATLTPSNSASQKGANSPTTTHTSERGVGVGVGVGGRAIRTTQASLSKLRELGTGAGAVEKKPNLVQVELPWRPTYLRRRVLAIFLAVFVALIIALEVLGDFSNRNAGLGSGERSRRTRFAWTYLPILALTLLAGMWTRVDHQAKAAAPWIRMSKGPAPAEKTLLLDYVNMPLPVSIVKAVLNRDLVVACTSMVSLHLGLLVVVSTALLTLTFVDVRNQNARITLNTAFVDDASGPANTDSSPFLAMLGLLQGNTFPDGVTSRYAYQQFSADVPFRTEIRATVDGLTTSLECEAAQLSLTGAQYYTSGVQLNTTVSVPDCSIDMTVFSKAFLSNSTIMFSRFGRSACGESMEDQRIVIVFASETLNSTSLAVAMNSNVDETLVNTTVSQSMQLICKPTYAINRLDVGQDGISHIDLDLADTSKRTLANVQAWDIAQAFFDSYQGSLVANFSDTSPPFYQGGNVTVDPPMYLALALYNKVQGTPVPLSALFDRTTLQSVADDYFRQYNALLVSKALMEESTSSTAGTIDLRGERLLVRSLVVQLMVTVLGVSITLTALAMCFTARKGFLPRDPNTIIDTAALLAHSRPLLQSLRGAGGGSDNVLRERLSGKQYFIGVEAYERGSSSDPGYFKIFERTSTAQVETSLAEAKGKFSYPINFYPVVWIASSLGLLAVILLLEFTLRSSRSNNGIANVVDDTYTHLLWTAMPALILSHFATYFASVDFTTRALAPYAALKNGAAFHLSVSLNYLDKMVPQAIFLAVKHRNFAVVTSGLALLVSSLFVAIAAPLFSEVTIPATAAVQLLSKDFFSQDNSTPSSNICLSCRNGTIVSSLILHDRHPYPPFTYEDLNFPMMDSPDTEEAPYPAEFTITASLPAIRPSMNCRMYSQTDTDQLTFDNFSVSFTDETNNTITVSTGRGPQETMAQVQAIDPMAYFGASSHKILDLGNGATVSHWLYLWGQLVGADTNKAMPQIISAMSCNETVEQVTALTTFYGTSLAILPSDPPVVDDSTAIPVAVELSSGWDYNDLAANISSPQLLDNFFASLVSSRYAIPMSILGDGSPDAVQRVADAIQFQQKITRAQVINASARRPTTTNLTAAPVPLSPANRPLTTSLTFNATATSHTVLTTPNSIFRRATTTTTTTATRRLTLDQTATRTLQSLLSLALLLSTLSWLTSPSQRIHPRPGTLGSIASTAALLADGNTFGLLGRGAEWSSTAELRELFMDGLHVAMGFGMGWEEKGRQRRMRTGRRVEESEEGHGARKDDGEEAGRRSRVFGISAIRTGGWGGGEGVGLGLQARVGFGQRRFVRDLGWRT
ncbi:hypothetical protein GE09DRAFT_1251557 [Coniochaeta sp. 2T2.1]|nr:hypothetical protein GE09DRAFT_1251557 [Coniochaeta sp. 2T2.1]